MLSVHGKELLVNQTCNRPRFDGVEIQKQLSQKAMNRTVRGDPLDRIILDSVSNFGWDEIHYSVWESDDLPSFYAG